MRSLTDDEAAAGGRAAPESAEGSTGPVVGAETEHLYGLATRVARSKLSVLILGETGVGKDVLARAIHDRSPRSARAFVPINCAALPPSLVEAELFGHERGAFTGADRSRIGLLEHADGGTVFLDELGELPLATQAKLLRVIEDQVVTPVGRGASRKIDVRFIAATNRDLERQIRTGGFRGDLFFRLGAVVLTVPPLRERPSEIPALARRALADATAGERPSPILDAEAIAYLGRQPWPGNIRELRNVIARAVLFSDMATVREADVRAALECSLSGAVDAAPEPADDERSRIVSTLRSCGGNQTRAAVLLGISRGTLIERLKRHGIPRPQVPRIARPKAPDHGADTSTAQALTRLFRDATFRDIRTLTTS
jgi:DNA-binding NtrC family response regulator